MKNIINIKRIYVIYENRKNDFMNPFRKRTGILPSYFTGRNNELNELKKTYESTKQGVPGHIILYGPKGIGKTCLLLKFEKEISDLKDVYPVRIPLIEGNFEDIYSLIIEKCSDTLNINISHFWEKINSLGVNIPFVGGVSISREIPKTSPSIAIEKILKIIYDELNGDNPVLILLFDDLQRIMDNNDSMKILSILQNALIELNLQGKQIMFVATGSEDIFSKIQDKVDSAVRIFEPFVIEPLSFSELCDAIEIPANKEKVTFSDDCLKNIYEISEGIPYYMQILAYNCFEEAKDNHVDLEEFNKSFLESLNILAQREFKGMYDKSSQEERKVLAMMAESDNTIFSYNEIKNNANLNSEPSSLLKNLTNKNIIVKESRGKYKLRDAFFKKYLNIIKPYNTNGTSIY